MPDLTQGILELVRLTSTNLPAEVERKLRLALAAEEPGSAAQGALETILSNVEMTRRKSTPICQDTGTPIFFVRYPEGWSPRELRAQIRAAIAEATRLTYLRPNAVDSLSGKNTGNNLGDGYFPTIHFEEVDGDTLTIDLMLKGGGCENVGAQV
jgi:fumarate hydratase class I